MIELPSKRRSFSFFCFPVKGWVRKGKVLQGMQQPSKALSAYQKALEIDPSNAVSNAQKQRCVEVSILRVTFVMDSNYRKR